MADTVTVKRNWKKKITAICEGVRHFEVYSLSNDFTGKLVLTEDMEEFIKHEMSQMHRSTLTYCKSTGVASLHIHSNLWYTWVNKIEW